MTVAEAVKQAFNAESVKPFGEGGGGCINTGSGFLINNKTHIFVKTNSKDGANIMFAGEYEGLRAIHATGKVIVPKPLKVISLKHIFIYFVFHQ